MRKIKKIIFDDNTFTEVKDITPLKKGDNARDNFMFRRKYESQFSAIEEEALDYIRESLITNYAEWNLDMISESDVEKQQIEDFSDEEILEEAKSRKLFGNNSSIISEAFIDRFVKIIDKDNQVRIDNLLSNLEKDLKII